LGLDRARLCALPRVGADSILSLVDFNNLGGFRCLKMILGQIDFFADVR
jgi:hypothetical protein